MTVSDFLISCNTNTIDITIFDKYDEKIFDGILYLGFHCDNSKKILAAEVEAWEMTNYDSIDIYTDCEIAKEKIIATSEKETLIKTAAGYFIKEDICDFNSVTHCAFPDMGDNDLAWGNAVRAWNIRNENHKIDYDTEH